MLVIEVRVKLFVAGVKRAKRERGIRGIRGFHPFPCNLVEVLQLFRVCIRSHELTRSGSIFQRIAVTDFLHVLNVISELLFRRDHVVETINVLSRRLIDGFDMHENCIPHEREEGRTCGGYERRSQFNGNLAGILGNPLNEEHHVLYHRSGKVNYRLAHWPVRTEPIAPRGIRGSNGYRRRLWVGGRSVRN